VPNLEPVDTLRMPVTNEHLSAARGTRGAERPAYSNAIATLSHEWSALFR